MEEVGLPGGGRSERQYFFVGWGSSIDMKLLRTLVLLLLINLCSPVGPLAAADLGVKVTPEVVQTGMFYQGAKVHIGGFCESGTKPVVVVRGSEEKQVLSVKGRVGPIWVSTGKVSISGVPSLYITSSPQPVRELLKAEAITEHELDLDAVKKRIRIEPPGMDRDLLDGEYLKLKTMESTYLVHNGSVKIGQPGLEGVPYGVDLEWPEKAPPGDYEVVVYECRNGSVVGEFRSNLKVMRVGFRAFMVSLSLNHGELYGLVAVVTASLAGFGIDFLVAGLRRKRPAPVSEPQEAVSAHPEHSPNV